MADHHGRAFDGAGHPLDALDGIIHRSCAKLGRFTGRGGGTRRIAGVARNLLYRRLHLVHRSRQLVQFMLLGIHVVGGLAGYRTYLLGGGAQLHNRARHFADQGSQIALHLAKPFGQSAQFIVVEFMHVEVRGEIPRRHLAGLLKQCHHWISDLSRQQPGYRNHKPEGHQADDDAHGLGTAVECSHILGHLVGYFGIDLP